MMTTGNMLSTMGPSTQAPPAPAPRLSWWRRLLAWLGF